MCPLNGTSFAAPLVSGSILLLQDLYKSRFGDLPTVTQIESWLTNAADPVVDPTTGETFARLDVLAAAALVPTPAPAPAPAPTTPEVPATPPAGDSTGGGKSDQGQATGSGTGSSAPVSVGRGQDAPSTTTDTTGGSTGSTPPSHAAHLRPRGPARRPGPHPAGPDARSDPGTRAGSAPRSGSDS